MSEGANPSCQPNEILDPNHFCTPCPLLGDDQAGSSDNGEEAGQGNTEDACTLGRKIEHCIVSPSIITA